MAAANNTEQQQPIDRYEISEDYYFLDGFFHDPPDQKYSCPICLIPTQREAFLTQCCGSHYCHVCIAHIAREHKPCPLCKSETLKIFPNKERQREISSLRVHCPVGLPSLQLTPNPDENKDKGDAETPAMHPKCSWKGELGYLSDHLKKKHQNKRKWGKKRKKKRSKLNHFPDDRDLLSEELDQVNLEQNDNIQQYTHELIRPPPQYVYHAEYDEEERLLMPSPESEDEYYPYGGNIPISYGNPRYLTFLPERFNKYVVRKLQKSLVQLGSFLSTGAQYIHHNVAPGYVTIIGPQHHHQGNRSHGRTYYHNHNGHWHCGFDGHHHRRRHHGHL